MDKFKQELEELVAKYPEIGDITLTIKRSVTITELQALKHDSGATVDMPVKRSKKPVEKSEEDPILGMESSIKANLATVKLFAQS